MESYNKIIADSPKAVDFQLTYICNLRCEMCGQWGQIGIFRNNIKNIRIREMDTETWKKIIDMAAIWKPRINLWGGEPLLRKDIFKIIRYIKSKDLKCSIVTNGTLIEKFYKEIIDSRIDKLALSVDGPADVHDKIRRRIGTFNKIYNGMKYLNRLKKDKGYKKPFVEILFTVTKNNYRYIKDMDNVCNDFGCDRLYLAPLMFITSKDANKYVNEYSKRFGYKPRVQKSWIVAEGTGVNAKELEENINIILKKKCNYSIRNGECFEKVSYSEWYRDSKGTFGVKQCLTPWSKLNIMPDGKANFCMDFPDYILGDVHKESLQEIWNGERAKKFREEILKNGQLPICNRCCWLYNDYNRLIREWKIEG